MAYMAVLVQLAVASATHDEFIELDTRVCELLMESCGPPPGLMTNLVYPEADGFVIASV